MPDLSPQPAQCINVPVTMSLEDFEAVLATLSRLQSTPIQPANFVHPATVTSVSKINALSTQNEVFDQLGTHTTPQATPTAPPVTSPPTARSTPTGTVSTTPKAWLKLSPEEKFRAAIKTTQARGGKAVSLNLSFGRESGSLHSENPMRNLSRRITEALKEQGLSGLPMALHLEVSPEGRLHLHGVVLAAPDQEAKVKKALRQGAGYVRGHAGSTQVKLVRLTDGDRWHRYIAKDKRYTLNELYDDRLTYTSQSLTRLARDDYEERRKAQITTATPANRNSSVKTAKAALH